ncbi:alpha-galactosidase [Aureococcus anophagefferens]|nr:alpha-galactosidase [Aureococcus anophagefferens]
MEGATSIAWYAAADWSGNGAGYGTRPVAAPTAAVEALVCSDAVPPFTTVCLEEGTAAAHVDDCIDDVAFAARRGVAQRAPPAALARGRGRVRGALRRGARLRAGARGAARRAPGPRLARGQDHHDDFSNTLSQINALGAPDWSGPFGWAYGDMMMTGGEGCDPYDPAVPTHCPKQTDAEYRTEAASYAVLSSPMMVGTDVRNMTKIMEELLLNDELLAIQRDVAHKAAKIRWSRGGGEALVRALKDGGVAVAQSNLGEEANVTV